MQVFLTRNAYYSRDRDFLFGGRSKALVTKLTYILHFWTHGGMFNCQNFPWESCWVTFTGSELKKGFCEV